MAKTKTSDQKAANVRIEDRPSGYETLLASVCVAFDKAVAAHNFLFMTDAEGLYDLYLDALPADIRQEHTCSACRKFIETYGGLVAVDAEDGSVVPIFWNFASVQEPYYSAFVHMHAKVARARVVGQFLSTSAMWGTPVTGPWQHFAVLPHKRFVHVDKLLTAGQAMAALKENYRTVACALDDVTAPVLDEAIRIFSADAFPSSEKFLAPTKWLRQLQDRPKGRRGDNVLWRAIAAAPEGYCHPRASVVWPLLEEIKAGSSFDTMRSKFAAMVAPTRYQRPQAAPSEGNIKAAEAIFEKLGLSRSLERRFARIEDLTVVTWKPTPARPATPAGGIFGHLKPKGEAIEGVTLPTVTITLAKFLRAVLPTAERLQLNVPPHGRFIALTTAEHADAPPILKWDREDERIPVAWYVYPGGSYAHKWGLKTGWATVTAVTPLPSQWPVKNAPLPQVGDGEGLVFVLEGCVDSSNSSNALFPECLNGDLHQVRSTIEAYSKSVTLGGRETASACGYDLRPSGCSCYVQAYTAGNWQAYIIDRWD